MKIGILSDGARGFDCNTRVSAAVARQFQAAGYSFVVRYVRRSTKHDYDLSVSELVGLLQSGLAVMVVQHVAAEGWHPTGALGSSYGAIAAEEARAVGVPPGVAVWCDLEGVDPQADPRDVIAFCNAWFDSVKGAGYDPGLYVGYGCVLTGEQLYYKLKFRRYWGAYNLNTDSIPAVRGPCMWQGAYPPILTDAQFAERVQRAQGLPPHKQPHRRVDGVTFEYDVDVAERDAFNNLPTAILPGDPG